MEVNKEAKKKMKKKNLNRILKKTNRSQLFWLSHTTKLS